MLPHLLQEFESLDFVILGFVFGKRVVREALYRFASFILDWRFLRQLSIGRSNMM